MPSRKPWWLLSLPERGPRLPTARLTLETLERRDTPSVSFAPAVNYPAGGFTQSVRAGDFNGDGRPDLVAAGNAGNFLSVFLGVGNGTFTPGNPVALPDPFAVTVGDFNADDLDDLAVTNSNGQPVSILLGNGDGTFTSAASVPVGPNPVFITVGDFDGDGNQDLATANYDATNGSVSVVLGNGDGTFQAAQSLATGRFPITVAVGDFDEDGNQDLAVARAFDDAVRVYSGDGTGAFSATGDFGTGDSPQSIAVADLNGDGKQDLAVANIGNGTVSVLLGDGAGSFSPGAVFAGGPGNRSVAVGDFDGDGDQDLVTADYGGSTVSVLLGDGLGGFTAPVQLSAGNGPVSVAVGDFNGDGQPDIASANRRAGNVSVLLNAPRSTATPTQASDGPLLIEPVPPASTTIPSPGTDPAVAYVSAVYRVLLGRDADAAGLAAALPALRNGTLSPADLVRRVWESPEHRARQADRYYLLLLGRPATPDELAAAIPLFAGRGETGVIALVASSPEAAKRYPDDASFTDALFRAALGRPADADALPAGTDRAERARAIVLSPESLARYVRGAYSGYLNREADATGLAALTGALAEGRQTFEDVAVGLLTSPEFFTAVFFGR